MIVISTLVDWLTRHTCAHEDIIRRESRALWLECLKCGRQTVGVTISQQISPAERLHSDRTPLAHTLRRAA